jgi:hypothetical protein
MQSELSGAQFRSSSRFVPQLVQMSPPVFAQHFQASTPTTTSTAPKQGIKSIYIEYGNTGSADIDPAASRACGLCGP